MKGLASLGFLLEHEPAWLLVRVHLAVGEVDEAVESIPWAAG